MVLLLEWRAGRPRETKTGRNFMRRGGIRQALFLERLCRFGRGGGKGAARRPPRRTGTAGKKRDGGEHKRAKRRERGGKGGGTATAPPDGDGGKGGGKGFHTMESSFRGFSTQWKRVSRNFPHNGSGLEIKDFDVQFGGGGRLRTRPSRQGWSRSRRTTPSCRRGTFPRSTTRCPFRRRATCIGPRRRWQRCP